MLHDTALPPGLEPSGSGVEEREGWSYASARWTPDDLKLVMSRLAGPGAQALAGLDDGRLLAAWSETVEVFRRPDSPRRRDLDPVLGRLTRLSPAGLSAALEAVLGGVAGPAAESLIRQAAPVQGGPVAVFLASNLPALAVQPLLPALALRRPVLLKSPSAEPLFAAAFVTELASREPRLAEAVAAATWKGGDQTLEAPVLAAAGSVVAYGEEAAIEDLDRRAPGKVLPYGPKVSLAAAAAGAETEEEVLAGLARDVALFDQRGCLSIHAVFTDGDAALLAEGLAAQLQELAERWPPGPVDPAAAAGVQQLRIEAEMRGLRQHRLALDAGTLIVEPEARFQPSPGLRCVRIHPLPSLDRLPTLLEPWAGRLQGVALAGEAAWRLRPALEALGVCRCAPPGALQTPDALWHNGGLHPLEALGGSPETA
jgi:hypothetical protein